MELPDHGSCRSAAKSHGHQSLGVEGDIFASVPLLGVKSMPLRAAAIQLSLGMPAPAYESKRPI